MVQINTILTLLFSRFYQLLYSAMLWGSSFTGSIIAKICLPNILVHLIEKLEPPLVWKELCRVSHLKSKSYKAFCPDGWWVYMLASFPKYDWLNWNLYWVIFFLFEISAGRSCSWMRVSQLSDSGYVWRKSKHRVKFSVMLVQHLTVSVQSWALSLKIPLITWRYFSKVCWF